MLRDFCFVLGNNSPDYLYLLSPILPLGFSTSATKYQRLGSGLAKQRNSRPKVLQVLRSAASFIHTMDSRVQFLLTGLVPVPEKTREECPMCYEQLTNPVTTPCKHIYCRECISTWLSEHTSCPMCRAQLFSALADKDYDEVILEGFGTSRVESNPGHRRRLAREALARTRLLVAEEPWLGTFGVAGWEQTSLARSTNAAVAEIDTRDYGFGGSTRMWDPEHGLRVDRAPLSGTALFRTSELGADLIVMGTLAPAVFCVDGNGSDAASQDAWKAIMALLWRVITKPLTDTGLREVRIDAAVAYRVMMSQLQWDCYEDEALASKLVTSDFFERHREIHHSESVIALIPEVLSFVLRRAVHLDGDVEAEMVMEAGVDDMPLLRSPTTDSWARPGVEL